MRLPAFGQLDDEQQHIYLQPPGQSILVVGPPGSGKTSMAIWRARVLSDPEVGHSVVLVTRNRLLAAAAGRLALEHDGVPIHVTTMNKLVWGDYRHRFGRDAPQIRDFEYQWDAILRTYEVAGVARSVDHMIIDEGQNLPPGFFVWAKRFYARDISIFADEAQTTHGDGSTVRDYANLGFTSVLPLRINHRNTVEIVDLLEQLHDGTVPRPSPARGSTGDRPRVVPVSNWDEFADIVATRYLNRADSIGVIVHRQWQIVYLRGRLAQRLPGNVRLDSYSSQDFAGAERNIQMHRPGVTIISSESAIGLEFDTLFLQDLDRSLPFEEPVQRRRLYMLCARARDSLILVNGPDPLTTAQWQALPSAQYLHR